MTGKRIFDLCFTIPGVTLLLPLYLAIALWIKLDSPGPVLFRQQRVGRFGRPFQVLKFRTMVDDAEKQGAKITVAGDSRITRSGAFLRKYKLDELPQLLNVLKGEMSLVGPRPEVPEYVKLYPRDSYELVLSVPPGITDQASIEFSDENDQLAKAEDPQREYVEKILPRKLACYEAYVQDRSLWGDLKVILMTIRKLAIGGR
ncbi:sugar transferase [Thiohalophilus sp.]|uniref:sugar transferase n=1 Tax=Thiohalophilus sp. TaxID=3028392 RepID=UPI002ACDF7D9|nr:sugar transferase [Thiohalophilus sp.]MDZ7804416.1 sugar transferase [Thiohalophilus sp.]